MPYIIGFWKFYYAINSFLICYKQENKGLYAINTKAVSWGPLPDL